jgi:hypothetical protein
MTPKFKTTYPENKLTYNDWIKYIYAEVKKIKLKTN